MSLSTMGRVPQQSAGPVAAALDAPARAPRPLARLIPGWRSILSDKPAGSALIEFLRYGIASGAALVCDFGLLVLLTEFAGLHYLVSAAIGFGTGILVAYTLSVRWVFSYRRYANPSAERLLFVVIGVTGLALNHVIMFGLTDLALLPYALSKIASVGVVFFVNFTLRKLVLFTRAATSGD